MIENRVLVSIKRKFEEYKNGEFDFKDLFFIQDNARIHTANKNNPDLYSVYDLFKTHGIKVEDWPPYSPDLNPMENCWSFLNKAKNEKFDTLKKSQMPKNKKDMFQLLVKCWEELDNNQVINSYNSFIDRMKKVVERKGDNDFNISCKTQRI